MKKLSEKEIDTIVTEQADDETAWEPPINVVIDTVSILSLPPQLAQKAAFFAQLHKKSSMQAWLETIIQERIAFEEAAFAELKQALATEP